MQDMATPHNPQNAGLSSPISDTTGPQHKRTYQACAPCRRRKVRCDLGPVDNPHEPPCVRCRRESKECTFSATRRKRKTDSGEDAVDDDPYDEFAARNGRRKSLKENGSPNYGRASLHHAQRSLNSGSGSTASPLDGYSVGQEGLPSGYNMNAPNMQGDDGQEQEVTNDTAAALFQSPINTPGDALHLLLKASGQSEDIQRQTTGHIKSQKPAQGHAHNAASTGKRHREMQNGQPTSQSGYATNIDPAISGNSSEQRGPSPSKDAINIWSRLRFVRAGWFTTREAISYIDYYYQYLAPLTPVNPPDLRRAVSNPNLLSYEPMLVVTLLTIASRYMRLSGAGGQTRSYMVHERLWQHLQSMITRMFWGQEQFGGGFCGAGARRTGNKLVEKARLRSLGTIESLLLLSDFHPRSMHFPPNDDNEDILAPPEEEMADSANAIYDHRDLQAGGESTFAGWTEPALRSDRMTWSLIGFSCALAHELGVFGSFSDGVQSIGGHFKRPGGPLTHHKRADRVERLLYIYMTQACGRFGFPSMYSNDVTEQYLASMEDGYASVDAMMLEHQSPEDLVQQYWVEIASINKACNNSLFPSKDQITQLIQTGEYIGRLQQLQPILRRWQERLERSNVAKYPKILLSIEVHYFRLYMNGLALQAVLEQWTTKVGAQMDDPRSPESTSSSFSNLYTRNEVYIKEVIDSARKVLRHVVEDLLPDDYLKHAPVRAYFRIVSAAMFLLKTFALGAKKEEVDISLSLLDLTISALRTSVVDDVHLCLRIADLLEGLTSSIRHKFVRFTPQKADTPRASPIDYSHTRTKSPPSAQTPSQNIRYIRHHRPESLDHSISTYLNAPDSNITVMPPPRSIYANTNYNQNPSAYDLQQPQPDHQQSPYPMTSPSIPNFTFPSEEDWLTLDLNPLLENNNLESGEEWFEAFGPETHNNLEVLGKLVNEQWMPGDMGF